MIINDLVLIESLDISTRSRRKYVTLFISELLGRIGSAEAAELTKYPLDMLYTEGYMNAKSSLDAIDEAVGLLTDAY